MSEGENWYPDPITAVGLLSQKIGNKSDFVGVPYVKNINSLFSYLVTGYYHVHGEAFTYPLLANPVLLTAGAGAWGTGGVITEVIPSGQITKAFDLHWVQVSDISAAYYGVIELFKGSSGNEIKISDFPIFRTNNFISEGNMRIQIPQQLRGERISAKLYDSSAGQGTCRIKLLGHVYG